MLIRDWMLSHLLTIKGICQIDYSTSSAMAANVDIIYTCQSVNLDVSCLNLTKTNPFLHFMLQKEVVHNSYCLLLLVVDKSYQIFSFEA